MRNHPPLRAEQLSERQDLLVFVGLAVMRAAYDSAQNAPPDSVERRVATSASERLTAAFRKMASKNGVDPDPAPTADEIARIQALLSGKAQHEYDDTEQPPTDTFLWGRVDKEH